MVSFSCVHLKAATQSQLAVQQYNLGGELRRRLGPQPHLVLVLHTAHSSEFRLYSSLISFSLFQYLCYSSSPGKKVSIFLSLIYNLFNLYVFLKNKEKTVQIPSSLEQAAAPQFSDSQDESAKPRPADKPLQTLSYCGVELKSTSAVSTSILSITDLIELWEWPTVSQTN